MYTLSVALSVTGHLASGPISGPLAFETVVSEIDAGRPVCCHIVWADGSFEGGHFNAIVGYDTANRDVIVRDPSPGFAGGTIPYEAFKRNYYNGKWDESYTTK